MIGCINFLDEAPDTPEYVRPTEILMVAIIEVAQA
jgi:hypothetical protein